MIFKNRNILWKKIFYFILLSDVLLTVVIYKN